MRERSSGGHRCTAEGVSVMSVNVGCSLCRDVRGTAGDGDDGENGEERRSESWLYRDGINGENWLE